MSLPTETVASATVTTLPPPVQNTPTTILATAPPPTPGVTPTILPEPEEAEPGAAIPGLIGPDIPDNVNPFTGLEVTDPAILDRRPILIKVTNSGAVVRPQSGLSDADFVWEHLSEGGLTRFTAMYYGHDSSLVGPVRSGRIIDTHLPKLFDAAFSYSGASNEVKFMFRHGLFFERVISPDFGHGGFWRDYDIGNPNKPGWETLYTNTDTMRDILVSRAENTRPEFESNMVFREEPFGQGTPVDSIEIRYSGTNVYWEYGEAGNDYLRWVDGTAHLDANNNQQLRSDNVMVLYIRHELTDIVEDSNGSLSIDIWMWEQGPVILYRDGQKFEGVWDRTHVNGMLQFRDTDGNLMPLKPGTTWFQVVPLDFTGLIEG